MTDKIHNWMERFRGSWKRKDVDSVLQLFADDVEYHETPFEELENKKEIRNKWETVREQEDIRLDYTVFSSCQDRHTVRWELEYTQDGVKTSLRGIYLIELDEEGKCTEFWQYCQNE